MFCSMLVLAPLQRRLFWNIVSVLVTGLNTASLPTCACDCAEHCLATDTLACEKGSAPLSRSRFCCVARNVIRMAKRWNIRSDGVCVVCRRVCDSDHMHLAHHQEFHHSLPPSFQL